MECIITESYNGSWCTCRYGIKAWLCRPMLEGDYIPVNVDEVFMVTRMQRYDHMIYAMLCFHCCYSYWLYGDLITSEGTL